MRVRPVSAVLVLGAATALVALPAGPAGAATVTVTTTADTVNGADGVLSLREAITAADADGEATTVVLAAAATYHLDLCVAGEDANAGGDLDYVSAEPLTVEGHGAVIDQDCAGEAVLDALDPDGVLVVQQATVTGGDDFDGAAIRYAGDVDLDGATISGNDAGAGSVLSSAGGVSGASLDVVDSTVGPNTGTGVRISFGAVRVTDSTITANTGRGLGLIDGTLTITGSTITGNGGDGARTTGQGSGLLTVTGSVITGNGGTGVVCSACGDVTISDSTISDNAPGTGSAGGGVHVLFDQDDALDEPVVTITRSTVSGNARTGAGGGVSAEILELTGGPPPARINIVESTVAGNSASGTPDSQGGGVYAETGEVRVDNSTITGNTADAAGGGVYTLGHDVLLRHATISGNTAGGVGDNVATNAALHTFGSVLAGGGGTGDCGIEGLTVSTGYNLDGDGTCALAGTGDQSSAGDPRLGPLAGNGGPTETMPPLPGSPALGAVPAAACTVLVTDQRGVARPQGTACEAGAVEVAEPPPAPECTRTGTAGPDVLIGGPGADVLCGLAGRDILIGLGHGDVLIGGDGHDVLIGGPGDDDLRGGGGADLLVGGPGGDSLDGGPGRDTCVGPGDTKIDC